MDFTCIIDSDAGTYVAGWGLVPPNKKIENWTIDVCLSEAAMFQSSTYVICKCKLKYVG